jgi:D-tyrosyl-tRNA(Tyr) deacylase
LRAVVQRSREARVVVGDEVTGAIDHGLVAFVGAGAGDTDEDLAWLVKKIADLRIFEDERGKMAKSVVDVGGGVLVVSQFTLYGDTSRGNRPSFTGAMEPEAARAFLERFVAALALRVGRVATGRFGADMRVEVAGDGPVTILLDSRAR